MKEITFEMNDTVQLNVNGTVYDIRMSDMDIMALTSRLSKKCGALAQGEHTSDEILSALEELCNGVDAMLGEGAAANIAGGKPISIGTALRMLNTVSRACVDAYAERLEETYA